MIGFHPAAGVEIFILEDQGILYSHSAQTIHALNTSATLIWCGLELGQTVDEVAHTLAETAEISLVQAQQYVGDSLRLWRELGLFEHRRLPATGDVKKAQRYLGKRNLPPYQNVTAGPTRDYVLLGTKFRVRMSSAVQEKWIHPVLSHMEDASLRPADGVLEVVEAGTVHHLYRDGKQVGTCAAYQELAPAVKGLVWQAAVNRHPYFLNIHAGVVGDGSSVLLLPGASGCGKSTLVAALSKSGWDVFSDEVGLLEEPELHVRPVRLGICIKSSGWHLVESYFPDLQSRDIHYRADGKLVRYLPPPPFSKGSELDKAYPVRCIVFMNLNPLHETQLIPIKKPEALQRILCSCIAVPVELTAQRIATLLTWIKSVQCYELSISSLESAIELISLTCTNQNLGNSLKDRW